MYLVSVGGIVRNSLRFSVATFVACCGLMAPITAHAAAGDLDTSFGTGGIQTTPIGTGSDFAFAVAIQTDGKIVAAGQGTSGPSTVVAVARYTIDGALDPSFGTGGKQTTDIGAGIESAVGVAIQADGKIVVAGISSDGTNYDIAVVRYNTDGSLDTNADDDPLVHFDTDGIQTTPIGAGDDIATGIAIQTDGKIVIGGYSDNGTNYDFAVVRYNTDGSLDTSFGTGGKQTTDIGAGNDVAEGVAIQSDGKIVTAGYSLNGVDPDFAVVRYNTDGSLDTNADDDPPVHFDTDGIQTTPIGAGYDLARAVVIQTDQKIVAGGTTDNGTNYDFALVRYNTDGSLDTSFGTGGKQTTPIGAGDGSALEVVIQTDGKIVAAGQGTNGTIDFAVVRYNPNGSLDTSFGTGGKQTTPIGALDDRAYTVAIQANGNIVVAGASNNGTNYDIALVRYLGASAPINPPANIAPPTITGTATVSSTLTCNPGTWLNSPTFTYEWKRNGATIPLMTTSAYIVQLGDIGTTLTCGITATNPAGSASATSAGLSVPSLPATDQCSNLFGIQTTVPAGFIQLLGKCNGNTSNNTLIGTTGIDTIYGFAGNDTINGLADNDTLFGGIGKDVLNGGAGRDRLEGGAGNDKLNGGKGRDTLNGGKGRDTLNANDHKPGDIVNCGPGKDTVTINKGDKVKSCERINRRA